MGRRAGTGISSFLSENFSTPRKVDGKAAFVSPLATPRIGTPKPSSKKDADAPKKKKKNSKNATNETPISEKKKKKKGKKKTGKEEKELPVITPAQLQMVKEKIDAYDRTPKRNKPVLSTKRDSKHETPKKTTKKSSSNLLQSPAEIQMVKKKIDAYDQSGSPIGTPKRSKPTLSSKRGSNHETPKKKTKRSPSKPLQSPIAAVVAPVTPRASTSSNRYSSSQNSSKQQLQTPLQTPQRRYLGAPTPKSGKKTSNVVSVFTVAKRTPKQVTARPEKLMSPEAVAVIRTLQDEEEKKLMNAKPIDIGLADNALDVLRNARSHYKVDTDDDDDGMDDDSSISSSSVFSSLSSLSSEYVSGDDTDDDDSSVDIGACGRFESFDYDTDDDTDDDDSSVDISACGRHQ